MTDKRFTFYDNVFKYMETGILDNGSRINGENVCDLLNELHEENNELRLQLNLCSDQRNEFHRGARENANRVGKLKKENEQLKEKNKRLKEKIQRERTSFTKTHERWSKEAETKIKELSEENEQLKKENDELKEEIKTLRYRLSSYETR